jgi:hypothetical protein
MNLSRYQWKPGMRYSIDAEVAQRELIRIQAENNGELTPTIIVAHASSIHSPIHNAGFTWNREEAAMKCNLDEARRLTRAIVMVTVRETPGVKSEPIQVWVSLQTSPEDERSYIQTRVIMEDDSLYEKAIADALAQLQGWKRRFKHLTKLRKLFDAIDGVIGEE